MIFRVASDFPVMFDVTAREDRDPGRLQLLRANEVLQHPFPVPNLGEVNGEVPLEVPLEGKNKELEQNGKWNMISTPIYTHIMTSCVYI